MNFLLAHPATPVAGPEDQKLVDALADVPKTVISDWEKTRLLACGLGTVGNVATAFYSTPTTTANPYALKLTAEQRINGDVLGRVGDTAFTPAQVKQLLSDFLQVPAIRALLIPTPAPAPATTTTVTPATTPDAAATTTPATTPAPEPSKPWHQRIPGVRHFWSPKPRPTTA